MLDGAGDAAGDVDLGTDGFAGLADLAVARHPAGIDGTAGSSHHTTQLVGQFLQHGKVLRTHHTPSTRDDELGSGDINSTLVVRVADNFDHFGENALFGNGERVADNRPLSSLPQLRHRHDIGAHGGHLGAELVAHDGGHDVAAKSWTGLHQVAFVVYTEAGAVGGQAGADPGGNRSGKVAPHSGSTHQDDFRLVFIDEVAASFDVGFGTVMLVDRSIEQVDFGGAVRNGFTAEVLDILTDHDRAKLHTQAAGKSCSDSQQLPGDLGRFTFGLLDKYPDTAVRRQFSGDGGGLRVDLFFDGGG